MHRWILLAAATCIGQLSQTSASHSQPETQMVMGNELLRWCADGSAAGAAACVSYIMGISDAVTHPDAISCPGNATRAQRREVVVRYMTEQPGNLDLPAGVLVTTALQQAFPCSSTRR
jgi:hypothetical protein